MDEFKWAKLDDVSSRLEAEGIKSLLEAEGIDVELVQEAIGAIFPVTVDGLGNTQIFVPKRKLSAARAWLKIYREGPQKEKVPSQKKVKTTTRKKISE